MPFFGTAPQVKQIPRFNQQQQGVMGQGLNQALSMLQNPAQRPGFEPIANRAREQFQNNTVPSIAARFSSMGTGGNLRSSAFNQALSSGASDLESQIAALGSQHSLQQQGLDQNMLFQLLSQGLQPQNENLYIPGQPGFLESAGSGLAQGAGQILPMLLMSYLNPAGAAGGGIWNLLSSLFGGNKNKLGG